MPPAPHPSASRQEILDAIADLRARLLDLSGHNPLLNYRHGKSSTRYLRIVDEMPGQVVSQFLNGRSMKFGPVPRPDTHSLSLWQREPGTGRDPNPVEWAEKHGIETSFDLPEQTRAGARARHEDRVLQTLHFPAQLEARLKAISRLAQTTVEETGVNMLHLIVGFLEWYESEDSENERLAPLITIPVTLEKKNLNVETNTYEYEISYSGEDCQHNTSLANRLEQDFGFLLPDLGDEFDTEKYLKDIAQKVSLKFPRWKVRRFMTLGFLNFGKLLMWRDLDASRWPENRKLENNGLIASIIAGTRSVERRENGNDGMQPIFEEEISIDQIENIYDDFPIIDNADSSQHSALIDAVCGKNLVIEGPPGTGKSQTITNLIAAALNSGKTVLFVSEKLAALEVVKQRLDRLGLGDFCLELHSHATKKAGVIESLRKRLERPQSREPAAYANEISRHRKLSDTLGRYVSRMNREWKNSGMTIHQILVGATRMGGELPEELREVIAPGTNTESWDRDRLVDIIHEARAFQSLVADMVKELGGERISSGHPWRGIAATGSPEAGSQLISPLSSWNEALKRVSAVWWGFKDAFDVTPDNDDLRVIRRTMAEVKHLPEPPENVLWQELPWTIAGGHELLTELADRWRVIEHVCSSGEAPLQVPDLASLDIRAGLLALQKLVDLGFSEGASLDSLLGIQQQLEKTAASVQEIEGYVEEFGRGVSGTLPPQLSEKTMSRSHLRAIAGLLIHLRRVGPGAAEWRRGDWIDPDVIGEVRQIGERLRQLQVEQCLHAETFRLEAMPEPAVLIGWIGRLSDAGLMRRVFSSDYRRTKEAVIGILKRGKDGFHPNRVVSQLQALVHFGEAVTKFCKSIEGTGRIPRSLWQGLNTDSEILSNCLEWHEWLLERHARRTGGLFSAHEPDAFGNWVLTCSAADLARVLAFERVDFAALSQSIEDTFEQLESLRTDAGRHLISKESPLLGDVGRLRPVISDLEAGSILEQMPGVCSTWTLRAIGERLVELKDASKSYREWLKGASAAPASLWTTDSAETGEKTNAAVDVITVTGFWGKQIASLGESSLVRRAIFASPEKESLRSLRTWAEGLTVALLEAERAAERFGVVAKWDEEAWGREIWELSHQIARNECALRNTESLPGYLRFRSMTRALTDFGLGRLAELTEAHVYSQGEVELACRHAVLRGLGHSILVEAQELRDFDPARYQQIQREFRELDQRLIELTRSRVAARVATREVPAGIRGARVKDHTEGALIRHEIGKKRSHIPIRQLLARAGDAAQGLKPCFMMGPRAVAQYLEPGGLTFDLLVIDEASQMKPADAIGAAARVEQIVVVGDPKQLPPTSFFDRLGSSDGDEEDQFAIGTSESILDATLPIFPARRLRWHYRSRHEALIAFSNRNFYDSNLLIFPATGTDGFRMGIQFRLIENGCFVDQVNQAEALAVAQRVMLLLKSQPELSLGVATMSAKQRDLIEGLIEKFGKEDQDFNRALARNREQYECLFVKNLETVQGDERAVMLISCTYGPANVGERVPQRFGPINSDVGWRRLNVLFTRARDRMEVFSSMRAGDILPAANSSRGVHALRGFLHYAETKDFEVGIATSRPPDSDFEIAVGRLLAQQGYEFDFQVGVAGFFIDLAVKHPQRRSEYIMGIECDGASYHTGKSVRDRDRLRQEIIEARGWKIRRIWSTDWFVNPRGAFAPILEELGRIAPTS